MAVAGFVCSLVGMIMAIIIICFVIGGPLALIGLILSIVGRNQAQASGAPTGLATAGLVMGVIGVLVALLWTIIAATTDSDDFEFDIDTSMVVAPLLLARARRLVPAGSRRDGGRD